MTHLSRFVKQLTWFYSVLLIALVAGCGGSSHGDQSGSAPGGSEDTTRPAVSAALPVPGATGVGTTTKLAVVFSKDMNAATISASSFTVSGPGTTAIAGTVSYNVGSRAAIFTPTNGSLPVNTALTATITTGAKDTSGNALLNNFVWTFTTGAVADVTPPTVSLTVPAAGAANTPLNTSIAATFSEDMDPSTIWAASFTLTDAGGTQVAGTVSYAAGARSAIFTPTTPAVLSAGNTYNATITTAAKDLSGNALVSNFTWTFNTGEQHRHDTSVDRVDQPGQRRERCLHQQVGQCHL